jgi:hypothetical protein
MPITDLIFYNRFHFTYIMQALWFRINQTIVSPTHEIAHTHLHLFYYRAYGHDIPEEASTEFRSIRFNLQASNSFDMAVAFTYNAFWNDIISTMMIEISGVHQTYLTRDIINFLNKKPIPEFQEFIRDVLLYGFGGYENYEPESFSIHYPLGVSGMLDFQPEPTKIGKEFKRIPIYAREWSFLGRDEEMVEWDEIDIVHGRTFRYGYYPPVINKLEDKVWTWEKKCNGVLVEFKTFKKKPYMLFFSHLLDRDPIPDSLARKILPLAEKSSHLFDMIRQVLIEKGQPPLILNCEMADGNGLDLRAGAVNSINPFDMSGNLPPVMQVRSSMLDTTEIMNVQNNIDGAISTSLNAQFLQASTKSNITADSINQTKEAQNLVINEKRTKFLNEFLKIFLKIYLKKHKKELGFLPDDYDITFPSFENVITHEQIISNQLYTSMQTIEPLIKMNPDFIELLDFNKIVNYSIGNTSINFFKEEDENAVR